MLHISVLEFYPGCLLLHSIEFFNQTHNHLLLLFCIKFLLLRQVLEYHKRLLFLLKAKFLTWSVFLCWLHFYLLNAPLLATFWEGGARCRDMHGNGCNSLLFSACANPDPADLLCRWKRTFAKFEVSQSRRRPTRAPYSATTTSTFKNLL